MEDQTLGYLLLGGIVALFIAWYFWNKWNKKKEAQKYFEEHGEPMPTFGEDMTKLLDIVAESNVIELMNAVRKTRVIICPNVAVLTILEPPRSIFEEEEKAEQERVKKTREMVDALTPVLRSNPTADLSPYERAYQIKIVSVEILKPQDRLSQHNGDMPIGYEE